MLGILVYKHFKNIVYENGATLREMQVRSFGHMCCMYKHTYIHTQESKVVAVAIISALMQSDIKVVHRFDICII